ncbi:putative cellulase [Lupinus albus]|uniref:Putative cellulase n=1 Tax=Lupinus albus TaxID=3870 RepID=A0A6A4PVN5_LUPAL|nr:putative cellulase [Lupinus albus]
MKKTTQSTHVFLVLSIIAIFASHSKAYPLSTHKKYIIDDSTGQRAKLVCGNWAGHLTPMMPEGLDKRPLKDIVGELVKYKFNCVRLTYAIHMWTRYSNNTVSDTLATFNVSKVVEGISKNNPWVLNVTHINVFETVVNELGAQNVHVLLDNHVSKPEWCCSNDDGNGFFNDKYFDPQEWIQGLTLAAKHFASNSAVVAQSLRNELRGPRQNENDWYNYMSQAAVEIHKQNPNILVVISGFNYDLDLQFLKKRPLEIDLGNKTVFEAHLYSWSGSPKDTWLKQPLNMICSNTIKGIVNRAGFLTAGNNPVPLIFSEFGFDQTGGNVADNRFLTCLQTYLVSTDMDWAIWSFHGTYYIRGDQVQFEELFGVMNSDWNNLRNPNFTDKFQLLQRKNQDPTSKGTDAYIIYHPLTGKCGQVNEKNELELGSCEGQNRWSYNGSLILINSTQKCLTDSGEGLPVTVSDNCQSQSSSWKPISLSSLHLATTNKNGNQLCLHNNSNSSSIVSSQCICVKDDPLCLDDPQSQWFQLVPTNV